MTKVQKLSKESSYEEKREDQLKSNIKAVIKKYSFDEVFHSFLDNFFYITGDAPEEGFKDFAFKCNLIHNLLRYCQTGEDRWFHFEGDEEVNHYLRALERLIHFSVSLSEYKEANILIDLHKAFYTLPPVKH